MRLDEELKKMTEENNQISPGTLHMSYKDFLKGLSEKERKTKKKYFSKN